MALRDRYELAVVTNDIYTEEDAQFLVRNGALPPERIIGVETGGCPHTAIREDASINLEAVDRLARRFGNLDIVFVESGGDNLAATFSPELSDLTLYVIDVAAGDKIPRKGGPGITKSDLLVINKIDLAPLVGASLEVMDHDARKMRGERPFVFTNLKTGQGLDIVVRFIEERGMVALATTAGRTGKRSTELSCTSGRRQAWRSRASGKFQISARLHRTHRSGAVALCLSLRRARLFGAVIRDGESKISALRRTPIPWHGSCDTCRAGASAAPLLRDARSPSTHLRAAFFNQSITG